MQNWRSNFAIDCEKLNDCLIIERRRQVVELRQQHQEGTYPVRSLRRLGIYPGEDGEGYRNVQLHKYQRHKVFSLALYPLIRTTICCVCISFVTVTIASRSSPRNLKI